MIKSINPATGETIKTYAELNAAGIESALVQAETSFRALAQRRNSPRGRNWFVPLLTRSNKRRRHLLD